MYFIFLLQFTYIFTLILILIHILIVISTAYGNLGNIVSAHGKKVQAEYFYRKALQYRSNMADVHYNL